ncbi:MAG: TA system VapC family ribonuclease toxin [Bryobacteraceae bacterium]|nr:TA system VapC family ribonuclease toxin [Bryobacteraceae bacterium]
MIVLDANILLCAWDASASLHEAARNWVELTFSGGELIGIPWQTAGAFLRVTTNARLPGDRLSIQEAVEILDGWVGHPNILMLGPGVNHWRSLRPALLTGQAAGPLATDAQLAALTMEHGGVLHTTDRDFTRFPGLRWTNPLALNPDRPDSPHTEPRP